MSLQAQKPEIQTNSLLDSLYNEALDLVVALHSQLTGPGSEDQSAEDKLRRFARSAATTYAASKLLDVVAWLAARKANLQGEIEWLEAEQNFYRLSGWDDTHSEALTQPADFSPDSSALAEKVRNLHRRVERLSSSDPANVAG